MKQPECKTHGPIHGFQTQKNYFFSPEGALSGVTSIRLSCGCIHEGVAVRTEYESEQFQRVFLHYWTGEPIIDYLAPWPN